MFFIFADSHLLQLQHLLAALYTALISCCLSSTAYDVFFTFLALSKRLISGSVHYESCHLWNTATPDLTPNDHSPLINCLQIKSKVKHQSHGKDVLHYIGL